MALLNFIAEASGIIDAIDRNTATQLRIAEALERLSPPIPLPAEEQPVGSGVSGGGGSGSGYSSPPDGLNHLSFAESPEEYVERTESESAFAISLGVAPWSPAFQAAIAEMRAELLKPKVEIDEETGAKTEHQYTEAEADEIVRDAFKLAQAEANNLRRAEAFERAGEPR